MFSPFSVQSIVIFMFQRKPHHDLIEKCFPFLALEKSGIEKQVLPLHFE